MLKFWTRIALRVALAAVGLLVVAAGGLALWLSYADLGSILERKASDSLGRPVEIGVFEIGWGDPLALELVELRIANAPWSREPDFLSIGRLFARLDLVALIAGTLRYHELRIEDAVLVLERGEGGNGNWDLGGGGSGGEGLAVVPKGRESFPTLLDATLSNGLVTYRTSSGQLLRIALEQASIRSDHDTAPASLSVVGAYNDVPARLDGTTDSFAALRDAEAPFAARLTLAGEHTTIGFDGTMMEPLDFDGVRGPLTLEAASLDDLLKLLGSDATAALELLAEGRLERQGRHWALTQANGRLAESRFAGALDLEEGGRGEPDDVSADLDWERLDLDAIVAGFGGDAGMPGPGDLSLRLEPSGPGLDARLASKLVVLAGRRFSEVELDARLAASDLTLRALSFGLAGGTLSTSGSLEPTEAGGRLALTTSLSGAEADTLARLVGAAEGEIRGRLDGAASLEMTGATLGEALGRSRGGAVLVMERGDLARELVERASADLRSLFRDGQGRVPLACQLAVMTLKDGLAVVWTRIDSKEGKLVAAGRIDLPGRKLDLTLQSERDSTGFFALDLPIGISGPIEDPEIAPLPGGAGDWFETFQPNLAVEALPAALRDTARQSPCLE